MIFDWYKTINDNFIAGNYSEVQVKIFVAKKKITAEQYETITGVAYIV